MTLTGWMPYAEAQVAEMDGALSFYTKKHHSPATALESGRPASEVDLHAPGEPRAIWPLRKAPLKPVARSAIPLQALARAASNVASTRAGAL